MAVIKDVYSIDGNEFSILIEVDDESLQEGPYEGLRGGKEQILNFTKDRLGEGLALTRNCAARVVESLEGMGEDICPDEFQLQFSIKLDAAVGAVIAQTTLGAQLQINMKWTRKSETSSEAK
jgi:Trypsin-co-occurring domain 1